MLGHLLSMRVRALDSLVPKGSKICQGAPEIGGSPPGIAIVVVLHSRDRPILYPIFGPKKIQARPVADRQSWHVASMMTWESAKLM